jgi:hypothetical protein
LRPRCVIFCADVIFCPRSPLFNLQNKNLT